MLLLRDVQKSDLPHLNRLAAVLNTVNLPNDEETLGKLIDVSVRSFAGKVKDPFEREYLFVLEEPRTGAVIGTSMVIAQHGTYDAPHIYYEVSEREHYSASIDRHFRHKVLSIAYNYEGPTEIGGLVVDPLHRSGPDKPGKQLSYVRFLYLAMHRPNFRDKVLAELMPPLMPDGRSVLWECVGKRFTGLTYSEADKLSRQNKEFIKELFPSSDIFVTLFPERVQKVLGQVGPQTQGVQRMLERIGFRYVGAGGPVRRWPALRGQDLGGVADPEVPDRAGGARGPGARRGRGHAGGRRARVGPEPLPRRPEPRPHRRPGRLPAGRDQGAARRGQRGEGVAHPVRGRIGLVPL